MDGLFQQPEQPEQPNRSETSFTKNIVLLGFMGTGKSVVGRRLAESLGYRFVDTDRFIEERSGRSIAEIIRTEGEEQFRQLEALTVHEVAAMSRCVISTGGGVVLNPSNVAALGENGVFVALKARPETILKRVQRKKGKRPLLEGPNPLERIKTLMKVREALYHIAPFSVDTSDTSVDEVVAQIRRQVLTIEA